MISVVIYIVLPCCYAVLSVWFWKLLFWYLFIVLYCIDFICFICVQCLSWQVSCPTVVWQNYGPTKWYMYVCIFLQNSGNHLPD